MNSYVVVHGELFYSEEGIVYRDKSLSYSVENITGNLDKWNDFLKACNGQKNINEILQEHPDILCDEGVNFVNELIGSQLSYYEQSGIEYISGDEAILLIEDLQAKLLYSTLYKNKFWQGMQKPNDVPESVYYGMAIENYHFLFRESWFDSPVLSYLPSTKARLIMNEFYGEEYGHDELILKALNHIGISKLDISEALPLPETLALCNALAYWAANEPLFFFTTMGILEGKDIKVDSYILAMEKSGYISTEFIKPIKDHASINIEAEHGILTRELFHEIPVIRIDQLKTMIANTRLFVEMYDNFHTAVWENYSNKSKKLLRRLSDI
ncbi:iron-containing redox enzyme family protein [Vibrio sp. AND4]|uniref:iron-containing redox enzyme family protein n=1 Tax=Vibrio sp. AND4 TaxID=314289 RepID=UPI00015F2246|nr:iron-containing redox enzyme family protein [Vibrio sp. AND4]EDP57177.1 hypothetical protein AND4_03966 [Vibrio sp. AND4]